MKSLQETFNNARAKRKSMPRPGTHVAIEYAPQVRIRKHKELCDEFVHDILNLEWALLTDESTLWDFHDNDSNSELLELIKQKYKVDASAIIDGNIADILDVIASKTNAPS